MNIPRLTVSTLAVILALAGFARADAPPAFLDAGDKVDLWMDQPVDPAALLGHVAIQSGARVVDISGVEAIGDDGTAPSRRIRLTLSTSIGSSEISEPMTVRFDDGRQRPIVSRDVLSEPAYYYANDDLGASYTHAKTTFKVWCPVASAAEVLIFPAASGAAARTIPMRRGGAGVWIAENLGDLNGVFHQYQLHSYGAVHTAPDLYGRAASPDLARSMVVDLTRTNPAGWSSSKGPRLAAPTDAVVYEAHIRDFTIDPASSVPAALRGTYLGVTAPNTHLAGGSAPTGLAYLCMLGVTHLHLLPFQSINPAHAGGYNWGYETDLFNVPEPRYATHPGDPASAIRDVKTMVERLHAAKIGVVMDVVYNHAVPVSGDASPFWATVPYYYFRTNFQGDLLNESGVGNAVDDEHPMVRKFLVDSLRYWLAQYKIDGFRFDLLGMFTPETVRAISTSLHRDRSDILLYGEPWTGGGPTRFGKGAQRGTGVAVFNDNFRNTLRGDLNGGAAGFALGGGASGNALRAAIGGSPDFTASPAESMNYVSIHDDMAYFDKIQKTLPGADAAAEHRALKFVGAMVLLSQGVPILEGGAEIGRTKGGSPNSYNQGDQVNRFDWARAQKFADVSHYYQGLIALRRAHPAFRCAAAGDVQRTLAFLPTDQAPAKTIAFTLSGAPRGDRWRKTLVIFHGALTSDTMTLPPGHWKLAADGDRVGSTGVEIAGGSLALTALSAYVLYLE